MPRVTPSATPTQDERRDYRSVYDVSGDARLLDSLIARLAPGGEIVLAGFYTEPLSFNFAPAFMREAQIRCAAEWQRPDLMAVRELVEGGRCHSTASSHTWTNPCTPTLPTAPRSTTPAV